VSVSFCYHEGRWADESKLVMDAAHPLIGSSWIAWARRSDWPEKHDCRAEKILAHFRVHTPRRCCSTPTDAEGVMKAEGIDAVVARSEEETYLHPGLLGVSQWIRAGQIMLTLCCPQPIFAGVGNHRQHGTWLESTIGRPSRDVWARMSGAYGISRSTGLECAARRPRQPQAELYAFPNNGEDIGNGLR